MAGLSRDQLDDIAHLNLRRDCFADAGYFTYDGDSIRSGEARSACRRGAVRFGERRADARRDLNLAGRRPADQPLANEFDYFPFLKAGVSCRRNDNGISGKKSQVQARLWGGTAGGGALHYLDCQKGAKKKNRVKDLDVYPFYAEDQGVPWPYRRHGVVDFGESESATTRTRERSSSGGTST